MTDEQLQRILGIASQIADSPPRRRGTYVSRAGVWWVYIEDLRNALDDAGIRWDFPKSRQSTTS